MLLPAQAAPEWWSRIFTSRPPDPPQRGGGRPTGGFCAIAPVETLPSEDLPLVSIADPTLVWVGNVRAVQLSQVGQTEPLWSWEATETNLVDRPQPVQLAATTLYQITVDIELQPDQLYEWRVYQPMVRNAITVEFATVSAQGQAEIQQNLRSIGSEDQIIERADYFASQQLWSDFWREVLSIDRPSDQLNQALNEASSAICP
ncbi:hypothetical protein H6F67_15600 [Microcoleus sp. FACHB-1515]|uniref:hypothetical protein n=1 Tax=Cyanophyceae TaxID=3028117 RepID=UPI0016868BF4|nr:hypothetical protein [Microcoleus sp. FACHB-1515]MBD2091280.1 hypothetical protein [Microcoleus sp. FACHB-1515]